MATYTTDAIGEEDPIVTSDAIGEEEPTIRVGEEGFPLPGEPLDDDGIQSNPFGAF